MSSGIARSAEGDDLADAVTGGSPLPGESDLVQRHHPVLDGQTCPRRRATSTWLRASARCSGVIALFV